MFFLIIQYFNKKNVVILLKIEKIELKLQK
jgi:hypothetical protein